MTKVSVLYRIKKEDLLCGLISLQLGIQEPANSIDNEAGSCTMTHGETPENWNVDKTRNNRTRNSTQ